MKTVTVPRNVGDTVIAISYNGNVQLLVISKASVDIRHDQHPEPEVVRYCLDRISGNGRDECWYDAINVFSTPEEAQDAMRIWGFRSAGNVNGKWEWSSNVRGHTNDLRGWDTPAAEWKE